MTDFAIVEKNEAGEVVDIRILDKRYGFTDANGDQHPRTAFALWSDEERAIRMVYPVSVVGVPEGRQRDAGEVLTFNGKNVVRTINHRAYTKAELHDFAQNLRKRRRRSTPVVLQDDRGEDFTINVDTEKEDESSLLALRIAVMAGTLPDPFVFRGGGKSFEISHAQFGTIAETVEPAIYAGYATLSAVEAMIESERITTPQEIEQVFEGS